MAEGGLTGPAFCRAYAALVDGWLRELLVATGADDVALVAVGGYGRAELAPGSDVDVLLVHAGRRDVDAVASAIWYPLWDLGLKVGHGVRTVGDAIALASRDLEVATSLLSVRHVGGDERLAHDLAWRAERVWRSKARRRLDELAASVEARHAKAGEVAFLLEPDLKEGRGGLRDVHALRWAEAAGPVLLPGEDETLSTAYDALLGVRVELHRRTGKSGDRLLLQEQDAVAAALGDADADALMARVSEAARSIAWTGDEAWARVRRGARSGPRRRPRPVEVGAGLVARDGVVELAAGADLTDPSLVLRAAAAAATTGGRVGRGSLERLARGAAAPGDPWPDAARAAFVELLAAGRAALPVVEALERFDLVTRLLPEWRAVRFRHQRNAYHRFTVDRHLFEAVAEAAALAGRVERPDLLLVGTFLHDIGKGRDGDHTAIGVDLVREIATRMGFVPADVEVLVSLVRHHLLLPDAATRRDLDDPATIDAVADAVGDVGTLWLLHALTEADSLATGPAAWGAWKAGLVAELVGRVERRLAGERAVPEPRALVAEQAALVDRVRAGADHALLATGDVVTVAARDRLGLFARVAGTLTLHGLDVLAARAFLTPDGIAVEVFDVTRATSGATDWEALDRDLTGALGGSLPLEARLAARAAAYAARPKPRAGAAPRRRVVVDNDASGTATVVEVQAPDGLGTLYRILRVLAGLGLDIRTAKVSTLGHEVVDAFYVVDPAGGKVRPERVAAIENGILLELRRYDAP